MALHEARLKKRTKVFERLGDYHGRSIHQTMQKAQQEMPWAWFDPCAWAAIMRDGLKLYDRFPLEDAGFPELFSTLQDKRGYVGRIRVC